MRRTGEVAVRVRALLWRVAVLYTLFVVYGSLVPLKFRALPWDEAVARFAAIPFLKLGIDSRADWVANLLLFIPLSYLWMGALCAGGARRRPLVATLSVIPLATALSVGIEFTQLFFPQRTVSQNDIFAETVGGVVGVLAWSMSGRRFTAWLHAWWQTHSRASLAERLAWTYLAGVLFYNVLPLDLTLSAVEIFHKWHQGKINLVPFAGLPPDPAAALYEVVTDALIWTPLTLLWRLDGTRSARRAWGMALGTSAVLEVMQLFVYSRVSDVNDVLAAAVGAALGSWLGGLLVRPEPLPNGPRCDSTPGNPNRLSGWWPFALALGWAAGLLFVFWFPFDFRTDATFVKSRLDFIYRVPFEVYYFGTEFRAITEVLRKMLFFAPLGGLLAWGVARLPWRWRGPLFALSMLSLALLPATVEFGQVMLPQKIADTTDWLLEWLGGLAGYGIARGLLRAPRRVVPAREDRLAVAPVPSPEHTRRWHAPLTLGGMGALFWSATHAPFMPYNVRELLRDDMPWLSALLFAAVCYWIAAWPVWLARRQVSGGGRWLQLVFGVLVYGGVGFLLLDAAVPDESLYDLAGSPVLHWPGQWELGLRWLALFAAPGALLYLAAQTVRRWRGKRLGAAHFLAAVPILMLAYWGVVVQADTDNLTELMAASHPLAFAALCAWLYTLFLAAALLASPWPARRGALHLLGVMISLPLAILWLHLGLTRQIDKYGQEFSALQFLLSTDRQHYAPPAVIWLRYGAFHVLVIAALAFIQWPYFRTTPRLHGRAAHAPH